MVDLAGWLPLVVPALGAVLAYTYNRRQAVLQQRAKLYADALAAMDKLQQGPYRIRVRTTDDPEQRQALADLIRGVQEELSHFEFLLRLDSPRVSQAFTRLVMDARELSVAERDKAWHEPPADGPTRMEPRYWIAFDNQFLWHACIAEMRRELRMIPRLRVDVDPRKPIDAEREVNVFRGADDRRYSLAVHVEGRGPRRWTRRRGPGPGAHIRVTWLAEVDRSSWRSPRYRSADEAWGAAKQVRTVLKKEGQAGLSRLKGTLR